MPPATSVRSVHLDAAGGAGGGGGQGLYDQSLLATTPEISRAAKQELYNVDLLEERPPTTHVLEGAGEPGGAIGLNGGINKEISYSSLPSRGGRPVAINEEGQYRPNRRPWYRRPVGIITIAIISIVIVGAIVGGAVGGTVGHHNNDTQQQQQSVGPSVTNGQGGNSGEQGVGPAGSTPSGAPVSPNGNTANTSQSTTQEQGVGQVPQ